MLDLTEIATKRTFRRRGFVVVPTLAVEVRSGLVHRLFPRLSRNAAKVKAWQGGETSTNSEHQPKTTTERNTTK